MAFSLHHYTLRQVVECESIGLHTGKKVKMRLLPAEPGAGIVFRRMDIDRGMSERAQVPARYDLVTDTMLGTTIENEHGVAVATVEHLMAALWGAGIDNAVIELHGAEIPIMDGSSAPFSALIASVGVCAQPKEREYLVIKEKLRVQEGGSVAELTPYPGFLLDVSIDFNHAAIAHQHTVFDMAKHRFDAAVGRARTFGFASDVEKLRAAGLARGGSLENAIVIGEHGVLNKEGLRFEDEFVRHKTLDCLGDFFLAERRILGKITISRPGHAINNKLIRTLYATPSAWRMERAGNALARMEAAQAASPAPRRNAKSGATMPKHALMSPERN